MHPTPVPAATPAEASTSQLALTQPQVPQEAQSATSGTITQSTTAQPAAEGEEQYLLVLSGLIGSGKSTFARALVQHFSTWRRCNQDELGDRHAVVYAARTALLAGHNVVIDRTNIDARQRRTWLELARDVYAPSPTPVEASTSADAPREEEAEKANPRKVVTVSLTLTISIEAAEERLRVRMGHETIKSPEEALGILPHFLRTYQKATTEEGFNYVFTYPAGKLSRQPSKEEIGEILFDRLAAEARADGVLPDRPPPRSGGGGRGKGGGRGRGEWRGRGRGASAVYTPHHQHQHQPYPQQQQRRPSVPDQAAPTPLGSMEGQLGAPPSFAAAASLPPTPSQPEPQVQTQP
ncbi:uncharacterized protein UTRI_02679 [Ustilago trichophora]|uniref:tRNA ligase kinase domain-containing protein n=1 Tax=Ustilago trichophora TaxID=86804 RepID=A0A5C3ENP9_9BASI|nr:uncharacterized protein UTRI_02679 [Ustilago trichophora]